MVALIRRALRLASGEHICVAAMRAQQANLRLKFEQSGAGAYQIALLIYAICTNKKKKP